MNKEIKFLDKETSEVKVIVKTYQIKYDISSNNVETRQLKNETLDEEKRINKIKEDIRKVNKQVIDTQVYKLVHIH